MTRQEHPDVTRYRTAEREQLARFTIRRDITKDQLLMNLQYLVQKHGVGGFVDLHDEWCQDGYVLPWERGGES